VTSFPAIEGLVRRLDRQEQELRYLRERECGTSGLGGVGHGPAAPDGASLGRYS